MTTYFLREPLGTRPLGTADFPLSIGGSGAAVIVPGVAAGTVAAVVGLGEDGPFLQRVGGSTAVRLGGGTLETSAWLSDGVRFEIGTARGRIEALGEDWTLVLEHDGGGNATEPPVYDEAGAVVGLAELPARQALEAIEFAAPSGLAGTAGGAPRVGAARIALIAACVAAVALLAVLMAASAVSIRVKPDLDPDAAQFEGAFPDLGSASHRLLLPGSYRLRVAKAGYVTTAIPVTVTGASGQRFEVALERLPGRLRVDTGGIVASVTVDGRPAGRAPGELLLPAGARVLTFAAPRYATTTTRLEIEGLGHAQDLKVVLEPLFARLQFESVPPGATVFVDGVALGATPLSAEVDAGRRSVVMTHPAFRTWEAPIAVKAGEAQTVGPVQLSLPDGTLVVRSEPAGADVSVAGAYRGRTPLTLALAPGVAYEVIVTRLGYAAATRSVRLAPRATETLAVPLAAELGDIAVEGEPADAELWVDGQPHGPANQHLELPAVAHTLEVRKAGLEPYRTLVTPQPGLLQAIKYSLKSAAELKAARFPATLHTGGGQELKLLPAGSFTMGSPRREPGRRSNEAQRSVELQRPVYLALRAVTNLEFRQFRGDHLTGTFRQQTLDLDTLPVADVSWQEAAEYCNWLSAKDGLPPAYAWSSGKPALARPVTTGYRLPTEAEWEYAARWNGTTNDRRYPWGSQLPIPPRAGNFADERASYLQGQVLKGYDDGFRVAAPVGSFPPNPLGFFDLGGNVLEWTSDFYTIYPDGGPPVVDPAGPADGEAHVIRGSSWLTGSVADIRLAWRDFGSSGRQNLGFRIARYAE
jgi:formylglycine-generating enzyme required for sulfatase activity